MVSSTQLTSSYYSGPSTSSLPQPTIPGVSAATLALFLTPSSSSFSAAAPLAPIIPPIPSTSDRNRICKEIIDKLTNNLDFRLLSTPLGNPTLWSIAKIVIFNSLMNSERIADPAKEIIAVARAYIDLSFGNCPNADSNMSFISAEDLVQKASGYYEFLKTYLIKDQTTQSILGFFLQHRPISSTSNSTSSAFARAQTGNHPNSMQDPFLPSAFRSSGPSLPPISSALPLPAPAPPSSRKKRTAAQAELPSCSNNSNDDQALRKDIADTPLKDILDTRIGNCRTFLSLLEQRLPTLAIGQKDQESEIRKGMKEFAKGIIMSLLVTDCFRGINISIEDLVKIMMNPENFGFFRELSQHHYLRQTFYEVGIDKIFQVWPSYVYDRTYYFQAYDRLKNQHPNFQNLDLLSQQRLLSFVEDHFETSGISTAAINMKLAAWITPNEVSIPSSSSSFAIPPPPSPSRSSSSSSSSSSYPGFGNSSLPPPSSAAPFALPPLPDPSGFSSSSSSSSSYPGFGNSSLPPPSSAAPFALPPLPDPSEFSSSSSSSSSYPASGNPSLLPPSSAAPFALPPLPFPSEFSSSSSSSSSYPPPWNTTRNQTTRPSIIDLTQGDDLPPHAHPSSSSSSSASTSANQSSAAIAAVVFPDGSSSLPAIALPTPTQAMAATAIPPPSKRRKLSDSPSQTARFPIEDGFNAEFNLTNEGKEFIQSFFKRSFLFCEHLFKFQKSLLGSDVRNILKHWMIATLNGFIPSMHENLFFELTEAPSQIAYDARLHYPLKDIRDSTIESRYLFNNVIESLCDIDLSDRRFVAKYTVQILREQFPELDTFLKDREVDIRNLADFMQKIIPSEVRDFIQATPSV